MKIFYVVLSLMCISPNMFTGEPWTPVTGYSSVNQSKTYNKFTLLGGQYDDSDTYEYETQVYNNAFADYDGYWSSSLPGKHYDTPFLDAIDNFTIGSARASELEDGKYYYTYVRLKKGNDSDEDKRTCGEFISKEQAEQIVQFEVNQLMRNYFHFSTACVDSPDDGSYSWVLLYMLGREGDGFMPGGDILFYVTDELEYKVERF